MPKDMSEMLTERFKQAVTQSFEPCPLIGPKWFRYCETAIPPYFQFTGVTKLAKATGINCAMVAKRIVEHLDVSDLDAEVGVSDEFNINVRLGGKAEASPQ